MDREIVNTNKVRTILIHNEASHEREAALFISKMR